MTASRKVHGKLHLCFSSHGSGTVLSTDQQPPLQVVRAFNVPDRTALVHIHNLSGGVFGSDCLETVVEVGCGARAQVTSTGATRIYKTQLESEAALQVNRFSVAEDGLLEFLPDPLIPFARSRYRQETCIHLEDGAGLFYWETVAPGREAHGESFDYDCLQINLDLMGDGVPLAVERIRLEPGLRTMTSPSRLGPFKTFTSFYICKVGLAPYEWARLEDLLQQLAQEISQPGEVLWGVSSLPAHGLVARGLSVHGRTVASGLIALWSLAKSELYGLPAIPPRKI